MSKKTKKKSNSQEVPKTILIVSQILAAISTKLVTYYAAKLFTTPIKHKVPKREMEMDYHTQQSLVFVPIIQKSIMVYEYGESLKKVLLVHGWSGRGTQLFKIADAFLKEGYSTISFDAPAHGKSPGNSTIMVDFIESILELEKLYGPFEVAVGHSLGGMSVLNAAKLGLNVNKIAVIGSGNVVQNILDDFVKKLQLKPFISQKLRDYFEKKHGEVMDSYSAFKAAATLDIPILVVHDENDFDVPLKEGIHIYDHTKNGELIITQGLGHRKILGDTKVIEKLIQFIKHF